MKGRRLYPMPWRINEYEDGRVKEIVDADGTVIVTSARAFTVYIGRDEAEAIVASANARDDLLAACKFALEVLGRQTQFYREDAVLARLALDIEAAVAKAEGVKSSAESPAP